MQIITVNKDKLLEKLKANRENHRSLFLKAQEGYRQLVIEELEKRLEDARNNKRISNYVNLQAPVDQTKDYDRAIAMLDMSVDDKIDISEHEFACYVMDDWAWKQQFTSSNSLYFAKYNETQK